MLSLVVALSVLILQPVACVRIAVVGGGIGGTSAAYYMNQLFGAEVSIDLYEVNDRVGGRLDLVEVNDKYYESGGAIIHTKNKYMMKMIEDFGLKRCGESQDTFGITDGDSMLFSSSTWSWVTSAKFLWRYGYDAIRLKRLVNSYLDKFSRIYDALDSGIGFIAVADLLDAMDPSMLKLTSVSLAQYLRESGFGSSIIDELAAAAVRVNYGQSTGIHALVGMVALAGAGNELTSVCAGNREVAAQALRHSAANQLLRRRVTEISRQDGVYILSSSSAEAAAETVQPAETVQRRHYDLVVMATPQTADHVTVKWAGFNPTPKFPGRYHNLSVTFLQAQLNSSLFSSSDDLPDDILCTEQCTGFNSIGRQTPTTSPPDSSTTAGQSSTASRPVYKLFSDAPPSDAWLADLLVDSDSPAVLSAHRLHWLAYPSYTTISSSQLQLHRFQLADGLFHINAIEWGASAMEMSAIGARNVANLAFNYWNSGGAQVEPPSISHRQRTDEL